MNLKELITNDSPSPLREQAGISKNVKTPPKAHNDDAAPMQAAGVQVDLSPIWKEVAANVDLKQASYRDIGDLSAALYKVGAISFDDHLNLSYQHLPDTDKKIDYIAHWQDRQEQAIHQGAHHEDLNEIVRIQSILAYVDSLNG